MNCDGMWIGLGRGWEVPESVGLDNCSGTGFHVLSCMRVVFNGVQGVSCLAHAIIGYLINKLMNTKLILTNIHCIPKNARQAHPTLTLT